MHKAESRKTDTGVGAVRKNGKVMKTDDGGGMKVEGRGKGLNETRGAWGGRMVDDRRVIAYVVWSQILTFFPEVGFMQGIMSLNCILA